MDKDPASSQLCELCAGLNFRALFRASDQSEAVKLAAWLAFEQARDAAYADLEHFREVGDRYFHRGDNACYVHQPNTRALIASAETCDLCRAISAAREPLTATELRKEIHEWPIYFRAEQLVGQDRKSVSGFQESPFTTAVVVSFDCSRSDDSRDYADGHLLAFRYSSTAERLALAKSWLHMCQAHHGQCEAPKGPQLRRPLRLLEISRDRVSLVHDVPVDVRYAALSYCWGTRKFITLRRDTEAWLSQGLCVHELPKTFGDAFRCALALDMTYLWIDALCIRQDDKVEKSSEISKMRDIYLGSQVTIEATAAAAVHEDFLETNKRPGPGVSIQWQSHPVPRHARLTYFLPVDSDYRGAIIHQRAWVLQERVLAPRTLSFGAQRLSFECRTSMVNETRRELVYRSDSTSGTSKRMVVESRQCGPQDDPASLLRMWWDAVASYAVRELTDPRDRLPAIGGLASVFHAAIGGTYVAGIWSSAKSPLSNLVHGLCWSLTITSHRDLSKPSEVTGTPTSDESRALRPIYTAPSWSWASAKGRPNPDGITESRLFVGSKVIADILAVEVVPEHGDIFGRLEKAHIDISAPSISISDPALRPEQSDPMYNILQDLRGDYTRPGRLVHVNNEYFQHHVPHHGQEFSIIQLTRTHVTTDPYFYCLVIESCGDGTSRRLFAHTFPARMDERHMPVSSSEEPATEEPTTEYLALRAKNYGMVDEAVVTAPWQTRTFRLI